jgi:hypothetical protein
MKPKHTCRGNSMVKVCEILKGLINFLVGDFKSKKVGNHEEAVEGV